jgi:3-hydroxyisobutyrate dehydrogenase
MDVGFIGLGAMGLPMARHLLGAGHRVTVASRSRGPIERAVDEGARDGGSPAGVAAGSDVVILCVPDSPDVVQVVGDLLDGLRPGAIVVDCSTIDPDVEREQHERVAAAGGRYLEAPVSGGTTGAANGTLTLMVGGDAATLEDARPALEPFSGRIVHIGAPGLGQVVKLCNNLLFAAQMAATAEATALALLNGADVAKLHEVLVHSTGDCMAVRTRLPVAGVVPDSPASNGWQPGFAAELMAKDLRLALASGDRVGVPMAATSAASTLVADAVAAGYGREDFSALAKVVFAAAGIDGTPDGP